MSGPHVIDVTDQTFEAEVLVRSHEIPVVVDLWAPWCGPCQALGPVLEALAKDGQGAWVLAKINTDENPHVAQAMRIQGIPAVKAFVDGRIVDEFSGALPHKAIVSWLEGFVTPAQNPDEDLAAQAEAAGDFEGAEAAWRRVLATDPQDAEALVGLARVFAEQGDAAKARAQLDAISEHLRTVARSSFEALTLRLEVDGSEPLDALLARIEADGRDLEARHNAALILASRAEFDAALEQLLQIVIRDREFGEDLGRKTMVRIFHIIGLNDANTRTWQRKLGSAMYV